jgi:hypothetical protein
MPARPLSLSARPRRRADAVEVVQDGQAVIYEPDGLGVHGLNAIATLLWHCLDGSVTLEELAADLADVFDDDLRTARQRVLHHVSDLDARGLLQA